MDNNEKITPIINKMNKMLDSQNIDSFENLEEIQTDLQNLIELVFKKNNKYMDNELEISNNNLFKVFTIIKLYFKVLNKSIQNSKEATEAGMQELLEGQNLIEMGYKEKKTQLIEKNKELTKNINDLIHILYLELKQNKDEKKKLEDEIKELKKNIKGQEGKINIHEESINKLKETLNEKGTIFNANKQTIKELNNKINEQEGKINIHEESINKLKETLNEKETIINANKQAIKELNNKINEQEGKINELKEDIKESYKKLKLEMKEKENFFLYNFNLLNDKIRELDNNLNGIENRDNIKAVIYIILIYYGISFKDIGENIINNINNLKRTGKIKDDLFFFLKMPMNNMILFEINHIQIIIKIFLKVYFKNLTGIFLTL